jgi:hypothetical protein
VDDVTKQLLLTQILLAKQQLSALESFITTLTAPRVPRPVTSRRDGSTVSDKIDEEIGAMFDTLRPGSLPEDDEEGEE